jgi:hypothetical protein
MIALFLSLFLSWTESMSELQTNYRSWLNPAEARRNEQSSSRHGRRKEKFSFDTLLSSSSHEPRRRSSKIVGEDDIKEAHEAVKISLAAVATYLWKKDILEKR